MGGAWGRGYYVTYSLGEKRDILYNMSCVSKINVKFPTHSVQVQGSIGYRENFFRIPYHCVPA